MNLFSKLFLTFNACLISLVSLGQIIPPKGGDPCAWAAVYTVSGGGTTCSGGSGVSVTLSDSQTGKTYHLKKNGGSSGHASKAGTGGALTWTNVNAAGTYTVQLSMIFNVDDVCWKDMNGSATVSVIGSPTVYSVQGGGCSGSSITLSGSQSGVSYQLKRGSTNVGSPVNGTGSSISFGSQSTAGTYTVTATSAMNCYTVNMSGSKTIDATSQAGSISAISSQCGSGSVNFQSTGTVVGTILRWNYRYKNGSGNYNSWTTFQELDNQTSVNLTLNQWTGGTRTYQIRKVVDNGSCSTVYAYKTVTVNLKPTVYSMTGGGEYCSGTGGVPIGLSDSQSGVSYQLKRNGSNIGSAVSGTGSAISFGNQTQNGSYTVVGTGGCAVNMSGSKTVTHVVVNSYSVTGGGTFCSGGAVVGLSDSQTGVTYHLERDGNPSGVPAKSGTGSALSWTGLSTSGTYSVLASTYFDVDNVCYVGMNGNANVTIDQPSQAGSISSTASSCGTQTATFQSTGTVVGTIQRWEYRYKNGSGSYGGWNLITETDNVTSVNQTLTEWSSGSRTYQIRKTVDNGTCNTVYAYKTVTINPDAYAAGIWPTLNYVCGTQTVNFTNDDDNIIGTISMWRYRYKNGNGSWTGWTTHVVGNHPSINLTLNQWSGGKRTYEIEKTVTGCGTDTAVKTVAVESVPNEYSISSGSGCAGSSILLTGSDEGAVYHLKRVSQTGMPIQSSWTGDGGTHSFSNINTAGTYMVEATSEFGCHTTWMTNQYIIDEPSAAGGISSITSQCGSGSVSFSSTGTLVGSIVSWDYRYKDGTASYPATWTNITTSNVTSVNPTLSQGSGVVRTYQIRKVVDNGSCPSAEVYKEVTVHFIPQVYNLTGGGEYCTGSQPASIALNGSQVGVNYELYGGTTLISTIPGTNGSIDFGIQPELPPAEFYTITAINTSSTGCTAQMNGSISVTEVSMNDSYSVTGGGMYCSGDPGVSVGLSGSESGVIYYLRKNGGASGQPSITGTGLPITWTNVTTTGSPSNPDVFTVDGLKYINVDDACFVPMTGSTMIGEIPLPAQFNVTGGGTYCTADGGAEIGLDGSESGVTYQLLKSDQTNAGNPVVGDGGPISFGNFFQDTYTAISTGTCSQNMLGSATVTTALTSPNLFAMTGAEEYCEGTLGVQFGLNDSETGVVYTLRRDGNPVQIDKAGTGQSFNFFPQTVEGTYDVLARRLTGGCELEMTGSRTLVMNSGPAQKTVTGTGIYCEGDVATIGLLSADSGIEYQLKKDGVNVGLAETGTGTISFGTHTAVGVYTVVATDPTVGCPVTMNGSVVIDAQTDPGTLSRDQNISATSGILTLDNYTGNILQWEETTDGNNWSIISGQTDATYPYSVTQATLYRVLVQNSVCSQEYSNKVLVNPNHELLQNFVRVEVPRIPVADEYTLSNLGPDDRAVSYTYSDGLGRTKMSSAAQAGPNYEDVVQHYAYNTLTGRQDKSYLPLITATVDPGMFLTDAETQTMNFYNGTNGVPNDSKPYSEVEFDARGRTTANIGVGELWNDDNDANDKKTTYQYVVHDPSLTTDPIHDRVLHWTIINGAPSNDKDYQVNELNVTVVTDVEGKLSRSVTDMRGLSITSQTYDPATSTWYGSYKVYDDFGRVRFIVPPKLSAALDETFPNDPTITEIDELMFQYEYDARGRVTREKAPGAGWTEYVYDEWDRLVLTRHATQTYEGVDSWTFFKYDALNRQIMSGQLKTNDTQADLQTAADASTDLRYESVSAGADGYTVNQSFPNLDLNAYDDYVLTSINYFDNYDMIGWAGWDVEGNNFAFAAPSGFTGTHTTNVTNLSTGSKVRILGSTSWLNTVIYYDNKLRAIQTISENHMGGADRLTNELDWKGELQKMLLQHSNGVETVDVLSEYEYTHNGQLEKSWQTIDEPGNPGDRVLVSQLNYNILGQLVEKNLHSLDELSFLQSVDYSYNIKGWTSAINNADLDDPGENDLFGMEYNYTNGVTVNGVSVPGRYDGAVSSLAWNSTNNVDATFGKTITGFNYDERNRLTSTKYAVDNSGTWNNEPNHFDMSAAYDDNGNITDLTRKSEGITIDDLNYAYEANSNKLADVVDQSGEAEGMNDTYQATNYQYDAMGNMQEDMNKEMVAIHYNHMQLVDKIEFLDGTEVRSTYDAAGNRLTKAVVDGDNNEIARVDYVGLIEYLDDEVNQVYTDEGRAYRQNNEYHYEYFLTDHQGNNRVAFGNLPERHIYTASMDTANYAYEESEFDFPSGIRSIAENHTPLGTHSVALNGTLSGKQVGPAKVLNIATGDEVELDVWAKYTFTSWNNTSIADIASIVSSTFGGASTGTGGEGASSNLSTVLNDPGANGLFNGNAAGEPEAYLQYMFFDASYNFESGSSGFVAVGGDAEDQFTKLTSGKITFDEPGYLFVYIVNESDQDAEVFFDDLRITHASATQSFKVTQVNEFYPFGLATSKSWRASGYIDPGMLYQSAFAQYDSLTGYYDFLSRSYDPVVGRFFAVDPAGQFSSPYTGMGNIPHAVVDPDGEFITWSFGKGGFSIGFNLTPAGIPWGGGINIGWQDGFSVGPYVEYGPRVGGTGLGSGSTVQQSFSYNFKHNNLSTTTTASSFTSFGPLTVGGSISADYDITNNRWNGSWGVNSGVGFGYGENGNSIGFGISYGSGGLGYGLSGNIYSGAYKDIDTVHGSDQDLKQYLAQKEDEFSHQSITRGYENIRKLQDLQGMKFVDGMYLSDDVNYYNEFDGTLKPWKDGKVKVKYRGVWKKVDLLYRTTDQIRDAKGWIYPTKYHVDYAYDGIHAWNYMKSWKTEGVWYKLK